MKKILLASSALVAVAFAGTAASAAERVAATVSGYMFAGIGYKDVGNGGRTPNVDDIGVLRDGEIHFNIRGTSDNGLTFSGRVELEAFTSNDQIDENWVQVAGSFGAIKIGGDDHASYNLATGIIFFAGAHIGHYDSFGEAGGPLGAVTNNRFGGADHVGIFYNTPVFSGFQAQVSYHPDTNRDGARDSIALVTGDADVISVGLNYQGTFSDVNVRLSGGYDYVDDIGNGAGLGDADAFMAGAQVGYMGFVLGGHWKEDLTAADSEDWVVNAGYTTGPWNFGIGYTYADSNTGFEMDKYAGWVNYALAPGVAVGAGVEYQDTSAPAGVLGSEGFSAMAIMSLSF